MKHFKPILTIILLVAMALPAASQSYFNSRALANRLKKDKTPVYPTAVDNSTALLETADSLAQESSNYDPSILFLPIVYTSYQITPEMSLQQPDSIFALQPKTQTSLDYDHQWLDNLQWQNRMNSEHLQRIAVESPWLVPYNLEMLPEPPKQYEAKLDPKKNILTIEERQIEMPTYAPKQAIQHRSWIHTFDATLQFSQAYMSENWYQGGENNINLLANIYYDLQLNQNIHPKLLFDLTLQYKVGVNSAPADSLRGYNINEDLFQANLKFGVKATKKFYYSMNMQFKTQLLQNFKTNTWDLSASFLTPGELNAGVGMTYTTKNKRGNVTLDASLSPLSYNLKMWRANDKLIDEHSKLEHQIGSSGEVKFGWAITRNIALTSRLFAFSDYTYLQGDWETTINFSINKFLSTQIYTHVRFDDSRAITEANTSHWQFKEIFSFGLQYKFR